MEGAAALPKAALVGTEEMVGVAVEAMEAVAMVGVPLGATAMTVVRGRQCLRPPAA